MRRALVAICLVVLLAVGLSYGVVGVILPPPPPQPVASEPLLSQALTEHLLLIVVDGLRYDVATDAERMPHFAAAMGRHASGEIWAGRVSMTSSAVLTYGTGQRGTFEQVARNHSIAQTPFNSWLANAHAAGKVAAVVGDRAWIDLYGAAFQYQRPDPAGVAINVDFNPQTFRDVREMVALRPNILIAHFVSPDHQAHSYGVHSARYRSHIHQFDSDLAQLLAELSDEWTLIVTSDHGAADTGTHGTDQAIQRRSPIFAYGPGIRLSHPHRRLDQADVPTTMALLLGVAPPAHSRGHMLADFIDLPLPALAAAACRHARHVFHYGEVSYGRAALAKAAAALAPCQQSDAAPEIQLAAAEATVRGVDAQLASHTGLASPGALLVTAAALLMALVIGWWVFGGAVARVLPALVLLLGVGSWLTYSVERLRGDQPNALRAVLFVVANAVVLFMLLKPGAWVRFAQRWRWLSLLLVPGWLLASYTANTQPESFVAVAVGGALAVLKGPINNNTLPLWKGLRRQPLRWPQVAYFAVGLFVLWFPGVKQQSLYPKWLLSHDKVMLAAAVAAMLLWALARRASSVAAAASWLYLLALAGAAAAGVLLRPWVPPLVGRTSVVVCLVAAAVWLSRGRVSWALLAGMCGIGLISRAHELLPLAGALLVAQVVGNSLSDRPRGERQRAATSSWSWAQQLQFVALAFGLLFVLRVGLSGELDFGGLDFSAGAFGDPHVSEGVIGVALCLKYLLADALVMVVLITPLAPRLRVTMVRALVVAQVFRSAMLMCLLYFCGGSFWTALRVMGDLPFALLSSLLFALLWLGWVRPPRPISSRAPAHPATHSGV